MRLFFILASPGPGGAETLVRNLCAELVGRGHDCHVAFLTCAEAVGNPAAYEREFLSDLEAGGSTYTILSDRLRRPVHSAGCLADAAALFRPDLVHSHLARGLFPVFLARLERPTLYTHHSVTANFPHILFRFIDLGVAEYVAVSRACRDFLAQHVEGPISLIPNGVSAKFASPRQRTAPARNPFVLSVGTLRPPKDYGTLINAAALLVPRLAAQGRNIRFAIAGEGEDRETLQQMIEARGLTPCFELLGARPDVAELMQQADLLANSSVREGLPVTLIEAAASGLPAVVTNVGGSPEVVGHGANGYVVPPRRPDLMADALFELLGDEAAYAAFSAHAQTVARRYTLDACVDAHVQLYERNLQNAADRSDD